MRADLKVYRDAVILLDESAFKGAKIFEKAIRHAQMAQRAFEAARKRFERHVAEHDCG